MGGKKKSKIIQPTFEEIVFYNGGMESFKGLYGDKSFQVPVPKKCKFKIPDMNEVFGVVLEDDFYLEYVEDELKEHCIERVLKGIEADSLIDLKTSRDYDDSYFRPEGLHSALVTYWGVPVNRELELPR